jgi:hypothetical protein
MIGSTAWWVSFNPTGYEASKDETALLCINLFVCCDRSYWMV